MNPEIKRLRDNYYPNCGEKMEGTDDRINANM